MGDNHIKDNNNDMSMFTHILIYIMIYMMMNIEYSYVLMPCNY